MKVLDTDAQNKENLTFYKRKPRSIIRGNNKIPIERLQEMYDEFITASFQIIESQSLDREQEQEFMQLLKNAEEHNNQLDVDLCEKALKLKTKKTQTIPTKRQNLHGKILIDKMGGEEVIPEFIKMWREHFVDTMKPKYLPKNWSIDHSITRAFGSNSKFFYEQ